MHGHFCTFCPKYFFFIYVFVYSGRVSLSTISIKKHDTLLLSTGLSNLVDCSRLGEIPRKYNFGDQTFKKDWFIFQERVYSCKFKQIQKIIVARDWFFLQRDRLTLRNRNRKVKNWMGSLNAEDYSFECFHTTRNIYFHSIFKA